MDDRKEIEKCFRAFVEGSLVEQNVDAVMELFSDDLMGIGMGAQGIVRCREDVRPILCNNKGGEEHSNTSVSYSNLQVRCYDERYGSICAAVEIAVEQEGKVSTSRIGQCASLRKIDGAWKIYMLQATPLSVDASELEAYPLSFADDEIDRYRLQEQMSELMKENTIAIYKINFTTDTFEQYIAKDNRSVKVEEGEKYERAIFRSANTMLRDDDRLRFIETFSLGNIMKSYENGKNELTLDYESVRPDGTTLWLRSIMRFYMDKQNKLKGYLYLLDIDRQKRSELEMICRAETDSMTGLLNKEVTRVKIEKLIQETTIPQVGAFVMVDLDNFKQVNDTYGHNEGDRVIREAAAILKEMSGSKDILGRLGGDEFGIFYVGLLSMEELCRKAEEICARIRGIEASQTKGANISCSIGISVYSGEKTFKEIYMKADKALYVRKKELGRNGFTFSF